MKDREEVVFLFYLLCCCCFGVVVFQWGGLVCKKGWCSFCILLFFGVVFRLFMGVLLCLGVSKKFFFVCGRW